MSDITFKLLVGICLSPANVAQIGRSTKGLDEQPAPSEVHHLALISPPLFMDLITFIIRVHKAFIEIDEIRSGVITRAQAAQVMRSFGGWDAHRIALHVLAALFDADSSQLSPEYAFELLFVTRDDIFGQISFWLECPRFSPLSPALVSFCLQC